jgi:hypothetical protein
MCLCAWCWLVHLVRLPGRLHFYKTLGNDDFSQRFCVF